MSNFLLRVAVQVVCGLFIVYIWDISITHISLLDWLTGWVVIVGLMPEIEKYMLSWKNV